MNEKRYHIIGGGIAGLTAARYIKKYQPDATVVLYEAAENCGGRFKSYYDRLLGEKVDNATHAVLQCNKEAAKATGRVCFQKQVLFYDAATEKISTCRLKHINEISLALFNFPLAQTARGIVRTTIRKMFPFIGRCGVYFSENQTNERIINPYIQYLDNIKFGYVLKDVRGRNSRATKLVFNKETISLKTDDQVICAIDFHNFSKIFKTPEPDYNTIINIHYRTSVPITLPRNKNFLAIKNGLVQWLFVNRNILSAAISNAGNISFSKDELAREAWKEICKIRKVKPAFVPQYRVLVYRRATMRQDEKNNSLRPVDCVTQFKNFFLAGDWTMRDWPCSIEAAAQSGRRAARAAVNLQKKAS